LFLLTMMAGASAQNYNTYFERGIQFKGSENYRQAEEYFSKAISIRNSKSAYLNRAETRMAQGNRTGFCVDLKCAAQNKRGREFLLYHKYCFENDTIEEDRQKLLLNRKSIADQESDYLHYNKASGDTIIYRIHDERKIFTYINNQSKEAAFNDLYKQIMNNLIYPRVALENAIQGVLLTRILIDKDGSILKAELINQRHPSLMQAVSSVLKKLRSVRPITYGDSAGVLYEMDIPVSFKLQ